jgi:hypothetical protein
MKFCSVCNNLSYIVTYANIKDALQKSHNMQDNELINKIKKTVSDITSNNKHIKDAILPAKIFAELRHIYSNSPYILCVIQNMTNANNDIKQLIDYIESNKNNICMFICYSCNDIMFVKNMTMLTKKVYNDTSKYLIKNDNSIYDPTLFRTRQYICPNKKCVSYRDKKLKEAVFYHAGTTYYTQYICTACGARI